MSIGEIEALLSSDPSVAPDLHHSAQEDSSSPWEGAAGRPLFVAFTSRMKNGQRLIRPVSARYMHKKEIAGYETKGP